MIYLPEEKKVGHLRDILIVLLIYTAFVCLFLALEPYVEPYVCNVLDNIFGG